MENAAEQNEPTTSAPARNTPAPTPGEETPDAIASGLESVSRKRRKKPSKSVPKASLPATNVEGQDGAVSPPSHSRRRKRKKRVAPDSVGDASEVLTPSSAPTPTKAKGLQVESTAETPRTQATPAKVAAEPAPSMPSAEQKQEPKVDPQPSGAATTQQANYGLEAGTTIDGGAAANTAPVTAVDKEDVGTLSVPSLCKRRGDHMNLASQPRTAADNRQNAERGDQSGSRSAGSRREDHEQQWRHEEQGLPTGEAAITAIFGGNSTYQRLALGFAMMTYFSLAVHLFIGMAIAQDVNFACLPPAEINGSKAPRFWVKTNGWAKDDERGCFLPVREAHNATLHHVTPCTAWVYEMPAFNNNIIQEWDLVCSRQRVRPLLQVIFFAGGLVVWVLPFLVDWAGRRPVMLTSVVASAACSLSAYFVESLLFFALFRFALGSCLAVTFVTSSVLLFEIVGGEYRAAYVMLSQFGFSFGLLFVAVMDQHQLSWRAVQLCCSLPVFACAIVFLVAKESPRWLVARGMFEEAEVVMMHAARVNGISRYRSMALWRNARNEIEKSHERWSTVIRAPFRGVLLSSNHFRFVLVMFVSRFSCTLGYLALTSLYVGPTWRSIMEAKTLASLDMASVIVGYTLMERYGHRRTTTCCFLASAFAMALTSLVHNEGDLEYKVLMVLGLWTSAVSHAVLPVQNVELFPQLVRTFGFCWGEASALLGALCSPYVAMEALESGPWAALVLIGGLAVLSACLTVTLPETRRPAPVTRNKRPSLFE
ncbi:solute carrier family 22 member 7-like [Amblyomma americanum]